MDWNNIFCLRNHPRFAGFGFNVSEPLQILSSECVVYIARLVVVNSDHIEYYII